MIQSGLRRNQIRAFLDDLYPVDDMYVLKECRPWNALQAEKKARPHDVDLARLKFEAGDGFKATVHTGIRLQWPKTVWWWIDEN